jgi:hypothetical protein
MNSFRIGVRVDMTTPAPTPGDLGVGAGEESVWLRGFRPGLWDRLVLEPDGPEATSGTESSAPMPVLRRCWAVERAGEPGVAAGGELGYPGGS